MKVRFTCYQNPLLKTVYLKLYEALHKIEFILKTPIIQRWVVKNLDIMLINSMARLQESYSKKFFVIKNSTKINT